MNIDSYREQQIKKFAKDIEKYDIPLGFRMFRGIDLYVMVKDELIKFNKGKLSAEEIYNDPENATRNVMKLWTLDKKKLKKK